MILKNTENRFGAVSVIFHWVMAFIVIGMLLLGLYITYLPKNLQRLKFLGLHKEVGILILFLVAIRFIWRLRNVAPYLSFLPRWERVSAKLVHWALYFFMVAMPLTGWFMSSAGGIQVSFFGLFLLPNWIPVNKPLMHQFANFHEYFAWGLTATICLHVLAAFKHLLIDRDDVMQRML